jgi:hypothetical protein
LFVAHNRVGDPYSNMVGEVSIPTMVKGTSLVELKSATLIQSLRDPTEGHGVNPDNQMLMGGLLVSNGMLIGTEYVYYDANGEQAAAHFSHSTDLSRPSFQGFYSVSGGGGIGYASGWLAAVPEEWQLRLGGPAVTGNCCIPIVGRTSVGPSAFSFDPGKLTGSTSVPIHANALLFYTLNHAILGPWGDSNPVYGGATEVGGFALIGGTRTALYLGVNGRGQFCYGPGTTDQAQQGKPDGEGGNYCYDPLDQDKGNHAYPYNYQAWAYDLNDLAAVKAGRKQPWDVKPYAIWTITFPTGGLVLHGYGIGGVAYDPVHRLVYVSQLCADGDDRDQCRGLVHAFRPEPRS